VVGSELNASSLGRDMGPLPARAGALPLTIQDPAPRAGYEWIPGSEPTVVCFSCNAAFPRDLDHCPSCDCELSVVRKCPSCRRIVSARHLFCLYCSTPFLMRRVPLSRAKPPSLASSRRGHRPGQYALASVILMALGAASALVLYGHFQAVPTPTLPAGQSRTLYRTVARERPSVEARAVRTVKPSEVVKIFDYLTDPLGNCWFSVSGQSRTDYILCRDVAAPKVTDAEKGFAILQHWMVALDNPAELSEAAGATRAYGRSFPASPRTEQLARILAERTRKLSKDAGVQPGGDPSFASRSLPGGSTESPTPTRQAAGLLPSHPAAGSIETLPLPLPPPLRFTVVGGYTPVLPLHHE
jgi:hypothetical protein